MIKNLAKAYNELENLEFSLHWINVDSMSPKKLYGDYQKKNANDEKNPDKYTIEWNDGVLTSLLNQCMADHSPSSLTLNSNF